MREKLFNYFPHTTLMYDKKKIIYKTSEVKAGKINVVQIRTIIIPN